MIDINNKKFNFYDPIKLIEKEKRIESFFSDIIFTLSEKYIPDREKEKVRNQFGNLIMNYANQNPGFQNIYSSFLDRNNNERYNKTRLSSTTQYYK